MARKYVIYVLFLVLVPLVAWWLVVARGNLERLQQEKPSPTQEEDLYLPEAPYLKFIALGHDMLLGDLVLAKAMTYYGSHYHMSRTFPFRHLKKLFFTAVQMDPRNTDAILLAGNILSQLDVQAAIEILKLGMSYHPSYWKFPEMIGYIYFFRLNDAYQAALFYEQAAQLPGHPPYVPSLSGKFYQESGRYEEALRVLYNFYSTTTDKRLKASFLESIEEIKKIIQKGDFTLKAKVVNVLSAGVVEIERDVANPHFSFLGRRETLVLAEVASVPSAAQDSQEALHTRWQNEYTRMKLLGAQVGVLFVRDINGQLKRDQENRLYGTIIQKDNTPFHMLSVPVVMPAPLAVSGVSMWRLVGQVVALSFTVQRVEFTAEAIFLHQASAYRNEFSAVIPLSVAHGFVPREKNQLDMQAYFSQLMGRQVVVYGLITPYQGTMRMTLYLPHQLKITGRGQ